MWENKLPLVPRTTAFLRVGAKEWEVSSQRVQSLLSPVSSETQKRGTSWVPRSVKGVSLGDLGEGVGKQNKKRRSRLEGMGEEKKTREKEKMVEKATVENN